MSVDIDDFDGPNDVQSRSLRVAKKPHKCSACGSAIRVRDLYCYQFFVFDGSNSTVKRCLRCEYLYVVISAQLGPHEVPDEELRCGHTWEEKFGEPPPPDVARLAFLTADEAQQELRRHFLENNNG